MLRRTIDEEAPTLLYHLRGKEGPEGVSAFLRMQSEAATAAYRFAVTAGARPDEAKEIAMHVLMEYPGKPVEMSDPSLINRDELIPDLDDPRIFDFLD